MSDTSVKSARVSLPSAVAALADALISATDPEDIYAAALQGISQGVGVERASVLLFDPDGVMRFKAAQGISEEYRRAVEGHTPWAPGEPAPAPILVPDVEEDPELLAYLPVFQRENIRALGFIPLVSQGRTIGKFMLYWATPYTPPPEILEAALTIGALVALAVERSRQNAESRENTRRMQEALRQESLARERLTRLAEDANRLQIPLDAARVIEEVLAMARNAVTADAYAVWRRTDGVWRVAASAGLDEEFTRVELPSGDAVPFTSPIVAEDVQTAAMLDIRQQAYRRAGIRSLVSIPLAIRGRPGGSIAFYYREPRRPSELELGIAQALGHLAASAISSAELFSEQQALRQVAVRGGDRAAFLAEVSGRLSSLEYEKNLESIAQLLVPRFADWCGVDLLEGGELRRLAIAHTDPARVEFAREIHRRFPPRRGDPGGIWHVIETGEPLLYPHVDDAQLARSARTPEHLALLRGLGVRSAILVPLKRGTRVFGVLTLVLSEREASYDAEDLQFAEELARRAAFAIENARLYRQANEANRAKDEFLAALSHELRTPLNAILGWASILRAKAEGQIDRGLDVIYRNAKVQAELVDDLLDASRIVSGRLSLDLKDTPLRPILEAAVETVMPSAAEKDIQVRTTYPPPQVTIRGDSARLQQVFWNLLNNAVKFTPRGGRVTISSRADEGGVTVQVNDTGAGIRPEALPLIFDRFKQADSSTTRRYRGLGLGLTLARQLTEMHGGRITAESAGPGHGATFTVTLPATEAVAARDAAAPDVPAAASIAGRRVLAVDDDPDSLEVLVSLLEMRDAQVRGASSAVQALELVEQEAPEVIVSDIAMPDHDGFWLIEQLRRIAAEGGRSVPCVALTAFANPAVREKALEAGFAAHVSKPLNPDELVDIIRQLLR